MEALGQRDVGGRARLRLRRGRASGDGRAIGLRRRPAGLLRRDRMPATAPVEPSTSSGSSTQFADRLASMQMNSQHPRQFGYFTPPPLPMSIMGELLTQVTNQGVDVWHAGPSRRLRRGGGRPLAVRPRRLRPGVVRDPDLGRRHGQLHGDAAGARPPPRPAARARPDRRAAPTSTGARVYVSDQAHFSIARALDELGFPADTLVVVPSDERFRLQAAPVAAAIARDRAAGLVPFAIAAVAGSTNTGSVDAIGDLADLADAEDLWLHVDAAYGGAVRLSTRDARSGHGPGPRGLGDGRSAQVVLPGLRHRRAAGPRRRRPGGRLRRPIARVLPRR